MKRSVPVVLVFIIAGALVALGRFPGVAGDEAGKAADKAGACYELVAPLADVMEIVEEVFERMPAKLKEAKYRDLKREANFLAEMANLAAHANDHCNDAAWVKIADAMKDGATKMVQAATKKDEAEFKVQHGKVEEACGACHDKFRDN